MAKKGTLNARIVSTHDTEANWSRALTFVPRAGEIIIYDPDTSHPISRMKVGDGVTSVNSLPFILDATIDQEFAKFFESDSSEIIYLNGGNISDY